MLLTAIRQLRTTATLSAALVSAVFLSCHGAAHAATTFKQQSEVGQELKIPVHEWSDDEQSPQGVIVAVHGLVFHGKAYDALARHLSSKGFVVYAADMRGFGDWREPSSEFGNDTAVHFTQSKEDLGNLLRTLRKKHSSLPIYCIGESFGANYAVWQASTEPGSLDGVIACGISYKVCVHPRVIWVPTFFQGLAHPKKPINLAPYLAPILSENKSITQVCLHDSATITAMSPTDLIKAGLTNKIALRGISHLPPSMPILIVAGEKDQIQKTKTLKSMVKRMGSKNTKLMILPGKGHLLLEHREVDTDVEDIVDNWLAEQVASYQKASKTTKDWKDYEITSVSEGLRSSYVTPLHCIRLVSIDASVTNGNTK